MQNKDLLECCQSILDFLCEDGENGLFTIPTPKQKIMDEVLIRNGWGSGNNGEMIGFTEYLNTIFQMGYKVKDENGYYKSFFSSDQSKNFYRHFVRKLKLKQLL